MAVDPILAHDFKRQWEEVRTDVINALSEVGESGWYILGKQVVTFENLLASYCDRRHAIGCANGMDAIEIGLRSAGLEPGQQVLTTPLSAFATTLAIVRAGGIPVFVDVDESGLIDLDRVEELLVLNSTIRFLVPVHLYGFPVDLARLEFIRDRYSITIIEDMAQAIGARSGGMKVGCVGQASAISFYPTKNLGALGDGGALVTNDDAIVKAARAMRDYGQSTKYVHDIIGMNSRLDEIHASILSTAFLPRLKSWTERRGEIAQYYLENIRNEVISPLVVPVKSEPAWHLFPVLSLQGSRDELREHLATQGIQSAVHYPRLITDQKALQSVRFIIAGTVNHSHEIAERELSLPMHPYLRESELERVVQSVNDWRPM